MAQPLAMHAGLTRLLPGWGAKHREGLQTEGVVANPHKRGARVGALFLLENGTDCYTQGFDHELVAAVSDAVSIPVIASSGAGVPEHFTQVCKEGAVVRHTSLLADIAQS